MRNIFDQYRQPENQLSHALATMLTMEPDLCRRFVRWLWKRDVKGKQLVVEQQRIPGPPGDPEGIDERKGLPDVCIHDGSDWCLAIEHKIGSSLTSDQLVRHKRTLERCFDNVQLAAITAEEVVGQSKDVIPHETWQRVYEWLGRQDERDGLWVSQLRDFMRLLEARMLDENQFLPQRLTMFDGIPFNDVHPYSYVEAKLLMRDLMPLLRGRKELQALGIDPACKGRSAITGRQAMRVWNYISMKPKGKSGGFTEWPHLTLGIHHDVTEAMVTMPNSIATDCRNRLKLVGEDGFAELCHEIAQRLANSFGSHKGYKPILRVDHRHYTSQRSEAANDGKMEVDLGAVKGDLRRKVKSQPHWFSAAFHLVSEKNGCNIQLQIGCLFSHSGGIMRGKKATDRLAEAWMDCEPFVAALLGGKR